MPHPFLWLPDILLEAGLKVAEVPGWEQRGAPHVGPTLGVLCHHTVGARSGNMPSLRLLTRGRPGRNGKTENGHEKRGDESSEHAKTSLTFWGQTHEIAAEAPPSAGGKIITSSRRGRSTENLSMIRLFPT